MSTQTVTQTETQAAVAKYDTFHAFVLGEYHTDEYDSIADIATHGADAGYPHITYTTDIEAVYAAFTDDIWAAVTIYADSLGETVPGMMANYTKHHQIESAADLATFMVWAAVELIAHDETFS